MFSSNFMRAECTTDSRYVSVDRPFLFVSEHWTTGFIICEGGRQVRTVPLFNVEKRKVSHNFQKKSC